MSLKRSHLASQKVTWSLGALGCCGCFLADLWALCLSGAMRIQRKPVSKRRISLKEHRNKDIKTYFLSWPLQLISLLNHSIHTLVVNVTYFEKNPDIPGSNLDSDFARKREPPLILVLQIYRKISLKKKKIDKRIDLQNKNVHKASEYIFSYILNPTCPNLRVLQLQELRA